MNIAIIGYVGWYGSMAEWVARGFKSNGYKVTTYDRKEVDSMRHDHDLYLFVDCSEDYSERIPKLEKPKVFWSMDAHMDGGISRSVNIARKCDLVFSSNYEHGVKLLEKFGIKSFLLPITYDDTLTNNDSFGMDIEVAMIGHANSPERLKLWEILNREFKAFTGKAETVDQYISVMNSAKVIINQPTEPWDIILNNRFFEALGFGKLLFQKRLKTDLIEKMGFNEFEGFVYWDNLTDFEYEVVPMIKKYLADPESFEGIDIGKRKVERYSMKEQVNKMMSIILSELYGKI